jgi:hypothetical protein
VNPVLSTQAFWQAYLTLEPGHLSDDDFAAQVEGLRGDFVVIDKTITLGSGRRQRIIDYKIVEFTLSCGERFSFVLEYVPGVSGSEKRLVLLDPETGKKHQMG